MEHIQMEHLQTFVRTSARLYARSLFKILAAVCFMLCAFNLFDARLLLCSMGVFFTAVSYVSSLNVFWHFQLPPTADNAAKNQT
jgi:hypothetical protein